MRTVWTLDDDAATRMLTVEKLSITETARRLGVSRQAIHHAIQKGRVTAPNRDGGPLGDRMPGDATPSESTPNGSAQN